MHICLCCACSIAATLPAAEDSSISVPSDPPSLSKTDTQSPSGGAATTASAAAAAEELGERAEAEREWAGTEERLSLMSFLSHYNLFVLLLFLVPLY